jgi:hypothetical protein
MEAWAHRVVLGLLSVAAAASAGCGGQYVVTVPDQLAPAGGQTAAVIRLQRNEFRAVNMPVDAAPVRMRAGEAPERCAYTDRLGYAGAMLPAPKAPGRYDFLVSHLDPWGDEVDGRGNYYAWEPNAPAVAVDLDGLPGLTTPNAGDAPAAIRRLAGTANVLYLTRRSPRELAAIHWQINEAGYPDGPVLCWQREDWHVTYEVVANVTVPRIVVEARLVNSLPSIRQTFPNLKVGACNSAMAAEAFKAAGMRVVDLSGHGAPPATGREWWRWVDLRKKGGQ